MSEALYLDDLVPFHANVGWGELGVGGALGYEGKNVVVGGRRYAHALSTHPPARLLYELDGRPRRFRCAVALNDDVPRGSSEAEFAVLANGRPLTTQRVAAGEEPRVVEVELDGASLLELVVSTPTFPLCHAVWLEPAIGLAGDSGTPATLRDCLDRVDVAVPATLPAAERCLATVVSPGYESLLDDLLGSFLANSGCADALLLVFVVGEAPEAERVVAKYGATAVRCRPVDGVNSAVKSVLYSVARVATATRFLCLDADTVVLGDLRPLFAAIDACPQDAILACSEGNGAGDDLYSALTGVYQAASGDLQRILGTDAAAPPTAPLVNDGVFAGTRGALLALDAEIRSFSGAADWLRENGYFWRNQYVFNLALARLGCTVRLDDSYNVQLHATDVDVDGARVSWHGRPVRVLHANGRGRARRPELLGRYAAVDEPLLGGGPDAYAAFVGALRAWVGRHGLGALAWSFYGTTDGMVGRVRDPSTFPLLGLLHFLIRSNGCVRVIETGTAKGVSTACIASAVAHRHDGRVVTIDAAPDALRHDLWRLLPSELSACIEERNGDSPAELRRALDAGERFHAALLDTQHDSPHVLREFELARRLVVPGGPILVHDPLWAPGSVADALAQIAADGYGVVRLWSAEGTVREDDGLGLAVIENRRRA